MHSLRRYDWTLHLVTIAMCAYFTARALTAYMAGVLESSAAIMPEAPVAAKGEVASPDEGEGGVEAYKVIEERNIFNSAETAAAPAADGEGEGEAQQLGELGDAVKTTLDIKVQSTLMIGEGMDRRSSAIIAGGKAKGSQAFFVGDEETFAPNVKLTKVAKDRIEFVNGGRLEYAELVDWVSKKSVFAPPDEVHGKDAKDKGEKDKSKAPEDAGAESGGKIVLDQKEVDDALQNLDKLYSEVRIVPNFQDGKQAGMKVLSVKPGGLASKLGIRRGDILDKVNGQELDVKRGMELFNTMKDSKNFSLDVVRGGKNQTLEYEIK